MSPKTNRMLHNRRIAKSLLPILASLSLGASLGSGCFAHTPAEADYASIALPTKDDGLPESKMAFLGVTPDQWEARVRNECENEPTGDACSRLFTRAADRFRWAVNIDDAPGLLVRACAQGHRPSCAGLKLLEAATVTNAAELAASGCPNPFKDEECYSTAWLLSYACNEKKQAAACLALADLFAKTEGEPGNDIWVARYRARACAYGGFCAHEKQEAAPAHARGAE